MTTLDDESGIVAVREIAGDAENYETPWIWLFGLMGVSAISAAPLAQIALTEFLAAFAEN